MNWSDPQTLHKSMMDPAIWLTGVFYPQDERERVLRIFNIAGNYIADDQAVANIFKDNLAGGAMVGEIREEIRANKD